MLDSVASDSASCGPDLLYPIALTVYLAAWGLSCGTGTLPGDRDAVLPAFSALNMLSNIVNTDLKLNSFLNSVLKTSMTSNYESRIYRGTPSI